MALECDSKRREYVTEQARLRQLNKEERMSEDISSRFEHRLNSCSLALHDSTKKK